MKQGLSIALLIVYIGLISKPIVPYIDYLINQEYISKFFCINKSEPITTCGGACYLTNQLKETDQDSSEENLPKSAKEEPQVLHTALVKPSKLSIAKQLSCSAFKRLKIHSIYLDVPSLPPKYFNC